MSLQLLFPSKTIHHTLGMEERKMQHMLWSNFKEVWMQLMKTESWLNDSSLMVHQIFKPLAQFCVKRILKQCFFMQGSMFCPCFSVTSTNSHIYRLVIYFLSFLLYFSNLFCTCFGSGISHATYEQLTTQATVFNDWKIMVCCKVQKPDLLLSFWYLQSVMAEASIEGHNSQPVVCQPSKNDCVAAANKDLEDEVF